ncbi:DNA invertase Pin-like site-specific DNA recombinase [Dysgonomonas sp. PFB1-18]|uniref:recombinase family protein n=1 Tax=unclassified Dysgonomonas TaxID=2630389 RepID=UPI002475E89B|nr:MULTISPECIES: recombinase family protein [unclassified Dysgonomonas]MDH6311214.1 DNA invertase Pin-like site-specific DNA recombinase [Dysgonomonas sp. PF1-14]MDH6341094.1 DNA invertase Pin-like site-specific DNA recombinase [Dysgonomonas sp. PF1-16]MDH6382530.1 DNA invertase Pin-like site-specific DNA recombinase [Dysgonomonas sp. PFB1-18]MDH6399936.1 DNA invertase Pin-like site-specific DNA recombinase [Dysgonomonas sp. PF1-23]
MEKKYFEIKDHRKNKSIPQWISTYISRIKTYMRPMDMFGEIEEPTIEGVYYSTVSIVNELIEQRKKSRQGINPTIKFDRENKIIRIYNSLDSLVLEIFDISHKADIQIYGYARVSTKKQSLKMQFEELKKFGCDRIVQEKVSATADRPLFDELLNSLKTGDTLAVWKLDRLGRSMLDLIKIIADLDAKGVKFVSMTENIDTTTATGKMMLMLFSIMAEYELEIRKERQQASKELARKAGKLGGRPKGLSKDAKRTAVVLKTMYQEKEGDKYKHSVSKICSALKISRATMYNYLKYMNVSKRGNLF